MSTIRHRLSKLRQFLEEKNLHAFVIPTTDPHVSEYPAPHWEARQWISGFTGSAGTVVVTRDKAGLWTDSRYFLQAKQELEGSGIELFKEGLPETPSIDQWLISELSPEDFIGIDGNVFAASEAQELTFKLNQKRLHVIPDYDPFAEIWTDRPSIPLNLAYQYSTKYAGVKTSVKIKELYSEINKHGADAILIATLDTIAWLFNIRGNDVKCNPVVVAYAYVSEKETILFINPKKLDAPTLSYLQTENVIIKNYDDIYQYIGGLTKDKKICLQSSKLSFQLYNAIPKHCHIIDMQSPADLMKSCKNTTEQAGIRQAMKRDGVALVRFLIWLEKAVPKENIYELDIVSKLTEYRSQQNLYVGESFDTIAGYNANGAIVHYHVNAESSALIKPEGFLLVDSGAQYLDGTTDITRTIALGKISEQMKEDYTMVLKGHIGIATCRYPEGTRGSQIDILARKHLWDNGLNYLHGTGHGVGHFLNVHEGPQNIRMNENPTTLQPGMVTSNEPGLYRANEYGIRIENLVLTQEDIRTEFGTFYSFETLSLCPIDTTPVKHELLTEKEIEWLNQYHKYVYDLLSPLINQDEQIWLKSKTQAIIK